ncbi:MAG: hypothetical protein M1816_005920 [Peltula sp. TS41687]|nr:MAG: hypothetical protein M1816_005920 [Peltula sp. TS41687]
MAGTKMWLSTGNPPMPAEYNRLINRAVIDEMSKRFIVTGQTDLQEIEGKLTKVETELEDTRSDVTRANIVPILKDAHDRAIKDVARKLQTRYKASAQLRSAVMQLQRRVSERHQPAHKLHEATIHAMQRDAPLESALAALKLKDTPPTGERDHRITLGAKMEIKIDCITMEDKFRVLSAANALKYGDSAASLTFSGGSPLILTMLFLQSCADFITNCSEKALLKLAVEASLYYANRGSVSISTKDCELRRVVSQYFESLAKHMEIYAEFELLATISTEPVRMKLPLSSLRAAIVASFSEEWLHRLMLCRHTSWDLVLVLIIHAGMSGED